MKLEIYDKEGNVKLTASPSASSTVTEEVMGECSLSATFTLPDFIAIDVNDYATVGGVRYSAKRAYKPQMNNTQEYTYQIKLYAPIHDAEQVVMLQLSDGSQNPEFSLTAGPREHLQKWVDNMNRLYDTPRWTIGTVIDGENRTIDYQSTKCWDAAFGGGGIAETYETELWADGYVVNLCRCERNLPVTLGYRKGLLKPRQDEITGDVRFFTRLIPLGSTRNIDPTTYGYSRLQLPSRAEAVEKNVDLYGVYEDTEEAAFSEIYPKYIGTVGVVRTEQKTNEEGRDYTVYYFTDPGMDFNPNDYELADQVKMISFQSGDLEGYGTDDDKSFQANWHEYTKEWEIINLYPDENTQIPGGNIIPRPGDTYFPWNIRMSESYTTEAERLYAEAVDDFLTNYATDTNQYSAPTDPLYCRKNEVPMMIGQAVRLESAEYFKEGFLDTRMTKVVRKLNDLYDATITCADKVGNGWKRTVDNQLSTLKYTVEKKGDTAFLNIIRLNDKTSPSDYNVFSSLKALATLLRKDQADTMPYLLTLLKGAVFGNNAASIDDKGVGRLKEFFVGSKASIDANGLLTAVKAILQNIVLSGDLKSDNFLAGALGTGYALIKRDADGKSYLEVDKLFARVKAIFAVLEIMKVTYTGGNFVFSPAGMNCTKVEEYDTYYRCYFTADDGEKAVENTFEVDDLVQLREFNVKAGVYENVANRYFWRRCIAKGDDYIDLSKTDRDMTSDDAPMAGDDLVTIGNKTIASRQNVIIISVYGEGSPSIIQYEGINTYSLDGKAKTVISPNGNKFTGSFLFTSGNSIEDELQKINDRIDGIGSVDTIYRIDLTNEISGVAADFDGTVTGELPYTDINVYSGNKVDTGWVFSATYKGCEGTIEGSRLTITALAEDTATVTITATKEGLATTLEAVMNIYKVRAGGQGQAAVIYSIIPSVNQIVKSFDGTIKPTTVSCTKYKTVGDKTTVTDEKTLRYKREGVDSSEQLYTGAVTVTSKTTSVVFALYDGSTMLDKETVPVLVDADGVLEESKIYADSVIEATKDNILLNTFKWIQGGRNLITNTYKPYTVVGNGKTNQTFTNWDILPECKGKSIVTAFKINFTGCTFQSGSRVIFQAYDTYGWNYQIFSSKNISANGDYEVVGIITAPSNLTGLAPVYIRLDYITGGNVTISDMRAYLSDSTEPLLPWEPCPNDLISFDSRIELNKDSISLKVQELVTGRGSNILYNSSFSIDTKGWSGYNDNNIDYKFGSPCLVMTQSTTLAKFLTQKVGNRILNKSEGTKYTISFDICKPSTLTTLNVMLYAGGTIYPEDEAEAIDLSEIPNYTWTRVSKTQTIKSESDCEYLVFGNRTGGTSQGTYYIKNVQLEYGDTATPWRESYGGLLATGIDIQNGKIVFTADNTVIQSNDGTQIAMFTVDANGKPVIKGENIDVDNLKVRYLETSAERYAERKDKIVIDAETNTFKMLIKDTSGDRNVFDLMFTEDPSYGTIADMLFNRYDGSTLVGRTQINQNYFLIESYLRNKVSHASKITSEYILLQNNNVDDSSGTVQDSIKLSASTGLTITDRNTAKSYNGKTQSIYVTTSDGPYFMNFYRGFFVGMSPSAWFSTSNKKSKII